MSEIDMMKSTFKYILPLIAALCSCTKNEHYLNDVVASPQALLFDAVFDSDGNANDRTGSLDVVRCYSSSLSTIYNDHYLLYTARFSGTPGLASVGGGCYKAKYSSSADFKRGLSDGFSIEVLFRPDQLANSALFTTFYADKGFGIELLKEGELKFTLATTDGVYECTTRQDTGHGIAAGNYYQVVGVWDNTESSLKLYLNGTQWQIKPDKSTVISTSGSLLMPSSASKQWLGIGAAPLENNNYVGRTFNGEIVCARIYDKTLYSDEIKQMYYSVVYTGEAKPVKVTELAYRTPCKIKPGNKYFIYGDGFESGDSISFIPFDGSMEVRCEALQNTSGDGVYVVLPENLVNGKYSLGVCRGDKFSTLGSVSFEISDTPDFDVKTGILAHRCVHGNGIPENSIAGLEETRRRGYFGAEFDVRITQTDPGVDEGIVVVCHDAVYGDVNLETSTYTQVSALKLSNGEAFPTLDSFLKTGKEGDLHLTFEIKNHADMASTYRCADKVLELVQANGYPREKFTVTSFDYEVLKYLRSKVGKEKLHLAYHGEKSPDDLYADGIDGMAYSMKAFLEHQEWIPRAHELGISTTTWTPSTAEDMTTFINLGIGSFTVNNVNLAQQCLERVYLSD